MKVLKFIGIVLFTIGVIFGCKKDNSNISLIELPEFRIDTTGQSIIETKVGQTEIAFNPKVIYNGDTTTLSYLWRMYDLTGNNPGQVYRTDTLGNKKTLKAPILRAAGRYWLELQVTTPAGLKAIAQYLFIVQTPVPYGWLVAYETADGANTDVAHIRTSEIVKGLTADEVTMKLYSNRNGAPLAGQPVQFYNSTYIFSTKDAARVNSADYGKTMGFQDAFVNAAPAPNVEGLVGTNFLINNGIAYWYYSFATRFINSITLTDDKGYKASPRAVSVLGANVSRGFFDEKNKRFIRMLTNESGEGTPFGPPTVAPAVKPRFTLYNVNKNLLSDVVVGVSSNTIRYGFFRDMDGAKTWMYGINFTTPDNPDAAMFELNAIPILAGGINQAKFFELGNVSAMAVCASATTVYGFSYGTSIQDASEGYTVQAGEEITCLKIFKNQGSGYSPAETQNNKILMLATWNAASSTGKLYMLPLNPVTGTVGPTPLKVISGFGKIKDMIIKAS